MVRLHRMGWQPMRGASFLVSQTHFFTSPRQGNPLGRDSLLGIGVFQFSSTSSSFNQIQVQAHTHTSTGSNCSSQGQRNSSCSFSQVTCIVRRVIFVSIVIFSWRLSCVITCCTLDLGVRNPQGQEPFPPGMSGSFFTSLIFESFLFVQFWQKVKVRDFL